MALITQTSQSEIASKPLIHKINLAFEELHVLKHLKTAKINLFYPNRIGPRYSSPCGLYSASFEEKGMAGDSLNRPDLDGPRSDSYLLHAMGHRSLFLVG